MRVKKYLLLLLSVTIVTGVVLYSCTRKKVDYLGPEYLSAPSGFSASNFTVTPAAFTSGGWTITADFSDRVTYYVTITGLTSGAEKQYTGVGNNITASSIGGNWNGSHDGLYFFQSGESVSVKLTFLRSDYYLEQLITLPAARNYFAGNPNILPIGPVGNVSYEASNVNSATTASAFPLQFAFSEALAGTTVGKTAERDLAASYGIKAIHGQYILRFSGSSGQPDGFFIGGIQHRSGGFPATAFLLPATWTDPTQIYFNVYVYGQGTNSKATVNLEFHESDASNPKNTQPGGKKDCNTPNTVGAFGHDPCTDDGWVYAIPVNFTGWKLVSVKYSDCTRSVSVPNGGNGDGVMEPSRLARLQMGVVANPAFANATVMFDYPVISYGAPFDPTN
jgi:hypothetical protein